MVTKFFSRSALHEHADPAQRILGAAELAPDSGELARLLAADPAAEVRIVAARRCADLAALAAAWENESDPGVRAAIAAALGATLSETHDSAGAQALLEADHCTDAIRSEVARRTHDAQRRRIAIAGIRAEETLIELAHAAGHAETRMAAAERVQTPEGLRKLAGAAKNKDRGVARHARQQIDAIENRLDQKVEADAVLAQLEALAVRTGPILSAVVELDRRWQALEMSGDTVRLARYDAARRTVQLRFETEQDEQRMKARFERRLRDLSTMPVSPAAPDALAAIRIEIAALREQAQARGDGAALAALDQVEQRIAQTEHEQVAVAAAETLVVEAEALAAGTAADVADLPQRWQALERTIRTPALTRRFEAALMAAEQRRLEQVRAAQHGVNAARQQVHALLHTAEQALAAGQLHAARAAASEIKTLKAGAGVLPKPTTQRLSRLVQQLVELERWESFGQQNARIQLCERAEAAATQTLQAPQLALEVQKLRHEWQALDRQHAGVPKKLWERFDRACETAYAPAAQYFAELAARRKESRKKREEFIAAAAAHVPTLMGEPRDWRAIERWLRDIEKTWREGDLGSIEPGAWKKFDTRLKDALAPLREVLSQAREQAKTARQSLIDEAVALAAKAMDRDAPSQIKALQARWQEQAKGLALARRDERALWERFRAACDAVFNARQSQRKEEDSRKHENRRALEELCVQLEALALATALTDGEIRRTARELQEQWKKQNGGSDPALRGVESRFKNAKTALDAMLTARARSREAAVWQTMAAKERVCEALDLLVRAGDGAPDAQTQAAAAQEEWTALPALPDAWEQKMLARRDGALNALSDPGAAGDYLERVENGVAARRASLLELELLLGLESPAEFQPQRLALQVKRLRERFKSAATLDAGNAGERLLAWCAQPGVADACDRQRCDRIVSKIAQTR
jgi:hypothetical protein